MYLKESIPIINKIIVIFKLFIWFIRINN